MPDREEPARTFEVLALGDLELRVHGSPLSLGGPSPRRLLLMLALRRNSVVGLDELVDALWPDDPPLTAEKSIQVLVSRIRRSLGAARVRLESRPAGYMLALADDELDLARAESLAENAAGLLARQRFTDAATAAMAALELWRGSPLMELRGVDVLMGEVTRVEELRMRLRHALIDAEIGAGAADRAIGRLEILVREHPLRERLWVQLMHALYTVGRQGEALTTFLRAREVLLDELGIEPGHELKEAQRLILAEEPFPWSVAPADLAAASSSQVSFPPGEVHLPATLDEFFGRAADVQALEELLRSHRLVTLTGPGGIGKTRLSIELARAASAHFPGGVYFVDLSAVREPDLVVELIARAVAIPEGANEPLVERIARHLSGRSVLLVLDNFEQVLDASPAVAELLAGAESVRAIVTSRAPLRVRGEREYPLEPLAAVPTHDSSAFDRPAENPALVMFANRAEAAGRSLKPEEVHIASAICARLDGLPLAIELAVARLRVVGPELLLRQLDRRLRVLVDGPRDLPDRHRTLEAAIAWSYELLRPEDRTFLACLSVLAGTFSLGSAAAVAADGVESRALDSLTQLIEHSLVMPLPVEGLGQRYRMLETIREFAGDRLSPEEVTALHRRALDHWRDATATAEDQMRGERQAEWVRVYEADLDSIRASLAAVTPKASTEVVTIALEIVCSLRRFMDFTARPAEIRARLEALLEMGGDAIGDRLRGRALNIIGTNHLFVGDHRSAEPYLNRALELRRRVGNPADVASTLANLALVRRYEGKLEEMRQLLEESIDLSRQAGDRWGAAASLGNLAVSALEGGDLEGATRWYEEALPEFESMGDTASVSIILDTLGDIAMIQGDLGRADELLKASVELARRSGNSHGETSANIHLADLAIREGRLADARTLATGCLQRARETADLHQTLECIELLAQLTAAEQRHGEAALLLGVTQSLRERQGWAVQPHDRMLWRDALVRELTDRLGANHFIGVLADGAALDFERVVQSQLVATGSRA